MWSEDEPTSIKHRDQRVTIPNSPILNQFKRANVGGTLPLPAAQLDSSEIEQVIFGTLRPESGFDFLGATFTIPNKTQFVLGLSYKDKKDLKTDEDFYLYSWHESTRELTLEKLKPRDVKAYFPALYSDYHHGDKSFFDQIVRITRIP